LAWLEAAFSGFVGVGQPKTKKPASAVPLRACG